MSFGERAAARKKSKELKSEIRELRRMFAAAGCDKGQTALWMQSLQSSLELGSALWETYEEARRCMGLAGADIEALLSGMDGFSEGDILERLRAILQKLQRARHECLLREDDLDFRSTMEGLESLAEGSAKVTGGRWDIMLRSELENVRAVLSDAGTWSPPDFFAFAYYSLSEDRSALGEMENGQRNALVRGYCEERFWSGFRPACARAGAERQVGELVAAYTGSDCLKIC